MVRTDSGSFYYHSCQNTNAWVCIGSELESNGHLQKSNNQKRRQARLPDSSLEYELAEVGRSNAYQNRIAAVIRTFDAGQNKQCKAYHGGIKTLPEENGEHDMFRIKINDLLETQSIFPGENRALEKPRRARRRQAYCNHSKTRTAVPPITGAMLRRKSRRQKARMPRKATRNFYFPFPVAAGKQSKIYRGANAF